LLAGLRARRVGTRRVQALSIVALTLLALTVAAATVAAAASLVVASWIFVPGVVIARTRFAALDGWGGYLSSRAVELKR